MESSDTGDSRWVPAIVLGGEATIRQRARNLALYQTLRDGDGTGTFRTSGLHGFVFEIPLTSVNIGPHSQANPGGSVTFRLDKGSECFRRLLHVISDHFPTRCDADDEVESLRSRVAELEAQLGSAAVKGRVL